MMKTNLWKHVALTAAWMAVAAGCTTEDWTESPTDQEDNNTPQSVLYASTPSDNDAQTRVGYNDNTLKLTWQATDQLKVVGYSAYGDFSYADWYNSQTYTYDGTPGETSGKFIGTQPTTVNGYDIYCPFSVYDQFGVFTSLPEQTQTANNNTEHLKGAIVLTATAVTDFSQPFTLDMQSCIMTFKLSSIPKEVGKLKMLQWSTSGLPTQTLYFTENAVTFDDSNSSLTAYLGFMPATLPAGGKFAVALIGDRVCEAMLTSTGSKDYEAGSRYTATISSGWQLTPDESLWKQMKFKVKTTDADNKKFNIPFPISGVTTASIKVNWGDGNTATIQQGTKLSADDQFNHTYAASGEYEVIISSSQTDNTLQQIPEMNFNKYRTGINDGTNLNSYRLTSIETPLLNFGTNSFTSGFIYCKNLTAIPATLFENNTQITDFTACFSACETLPAIPAGLFDNNKQAMIFISCFQNCGALTAIPKGLFKNNTEALDFKSCFKDCKNIKLNKNIFSSDGNTDRFKNKTMNFSMCFQSVGSSSATPGEAPELWNYTSANTWSATNTQDCFRAAKISNGASVPTAWGIPYTESQP